MKNEDDIKNVRGPVQSLQSNTISPQSMIYQINQEPNNK